MQALKGSLNQKAHFEGVGGPRMRGCGLETLLPMEKFAVMGLSDVLKSLPSLIRNFYKVKKAILKNNPSHVILIDSPAFNLRLAKSLRKSGFKGKIVQYICPTVWAWGKGRIQELEKNYDLLLVIYPFESQFFEKTQLATEYIGHPLIETLQEYKYSDSWKTTLGIPEDAILGAIFPGSREGEVRRNLQLLLTTVGAIIKEKPDQVFALSCGHDKTISWLEDWLRENEQSPLKLNQNIFLVPRHYNYDLMKHAHFAVAKSGTVTLELALHKCPTVVLYELTALNRFYAKRILKLKLSYYCIVNILSKKEIFPEFIEKKPSVNALLSSISAINEAEKRQQIISICETLKDQLYVKDSSTKAAEAILRC